MSRIMLILPVVISLMLGIGCISYSDSKEPSIPGTTGVWLDSSKEQSALAAADAWLELIDSGNYAASWREAAEYFKNAVIKESWQKSLEAFRKPLGNLISRTVKSKTYYTSLPGVPDGEYVVIQFSTSFTNKKDAIETVTPTKDPDGQWRVLGYSIR